MNVVARQFGSTIESTFGETDVFEIRRNGAELELVVRALLDASQALHILFSHYEALFETDEGNLTAYWGRGQFEAGTVFEVLEGGLLTREKSMPGLIAIAAALPDSREWLVATSNRCVTVVSTVEPRCRVLTAKPNPTFQRTASPPLN